MEPLRIRNFQNGDVDMETIQGNMDELLGNIPDLQDAELARAKTIKNILLVKI